MQDSQLMESFEDYHARHPDITPVQAEELKLLIEQADYEEYAFIMSYIFM